MVRHAVFERFEDARGFDLARKGLIRWIRRFVQRQGIENGRFGIVWIMFVQPLH
jgi:hypothetical protein